ncbi:hypothetical protein HMPREF1861_01777 [Corynebacterium kroppenstedtii]|nr:hypothetical protein HMPREF1861_01777 [Corynebacterium kroppenstedtii]
MVLSTYGCDHSMSSRRTLPRDSAQSWRVIVGFIVARFPHHKKTLI